MFWETFCRVVETRDCLINCVLKMSALCFYTLLVVCDVFNVLSCSRYRYRFCTSLPIHAHQYVYVSILRNSAS